MRREKGEGEPRVDDDKEPCRDFFPHIYIHTYEPDHQSMDGGGDQTGL